MPSDLERALLFTLKVKKLPLPVAEYECVPERKFRWDFAWPEHKVAVEVQGGIWSKGSHSSGKGLLRDYEKANLGALHGWTLLYIAAEHITNGKAIEWIRDALEVRAA